MTFQYDNLPKRLREDTIKQWQLGNAKLVKARLREYDVIEKCLTCFNLSEMRNYMHIARTEKWI